jgi:hypothetical protein
MPHTRKDYQYFGAVLKALAGKFVSVDARAVRSDVRSSDELILTCL